MIFVGLAGVALVRLGDWYTGTEWVFTFLYLLPIAFVTWAAGKLPAAAAPVADS